MNVRRGDWFRIKPRSDIGGAPLLHVEDARGGITVTDWLSFTERFWRLMPPTYVREVPGPRKFGLSRADAIGRLAKHWKRVTPPETLLERD